MFDNLATIMCNNPYDLDFESTNLCRGIANSKYFNLDAECSSDGSFWFCVLRCFLFDEEDLNYDALLRLSQYIRSHYKASNISCKGSKFNEVKYIVTAKSEATDAIIARIEFNKVCDEWIPLHYAYLLIIKHMIDKGIQASCDVILEVFAETEEGTYDLGIATMVKLYKYTTNKRQVFSNIVNDLIDSYNLYMYVRLLDDYHNNYDSKGNKIYEDFLNNKETSNFVVAYNKAVEFITEYNDIDVCDIPEFLNEIKGSRMLNEYTDIDTLVGEDFYLT